MPETTAVFIGQRPVMNYVLTCITLLQSRNEQVAIKARGRATSRAVDVVEIIRKRFMPDIRVGPITIGKEQLPSQQGGAPTSISGMERVTAK